MKKKAAALIFVLVIIIIVGIGTTAILQAMVSYANMKIITIERTKAQYLAEAGMQYAVNQCKNGDLTSPVNIDTEEFPITITKTPQGGSYKIEVKVQYKGL